MTANPLIASPFDDGHAFPLKQRSLPYAEDPAVFHRDHVERPFHDISDAINELPDGPLKQSYEADLLLAGGTPQMKSGTVAPAFNSQTGGDTQLVAIFSANDPRPLGTLREVFP